MWENGYRTREICTIVAADFFGSHFREIEYPDMDEENALQVAYGPSDMLYDEHTAMDCIINHAYVSFENENAVKIRERMEAVWDNNLHVKRFHHKFQKHYAVTEESSNTINRKVFTFEYESEDGCWSTRQNPSRAVVVINDNKMSMAKIRGVDPTLEQAAAMCLAAASHSAAIHEYNRNERVNPYRINSRIGYSGCEDYCLDIYGRDGSTFFKKFTAAKLHVSMAEKVSLSPITDMYVGDILELLTAAMGYSDFQYFRRKISKRFGVRFVRPYKNEILTEDDMDFIPKENGHRRPSRRRR